MTMTSYRSLSGALCLGLLSACTATKLTTKAQLPPPLIEQLPVRVGIHYSKEFREYVHKETRGSIDYEVNLGAAHVTNLDWLLKAMFREVVQVEDPARIAAIAPPLAFVLEPKFEEYSFLTPKDVAGEAFIVTIRYLMTLYDGGGARVDSFTFTGYGREKARALASKEPLATATQRAMRDAGAKIAVELTDQESVRLLLRGAGSPLPVSPPAPPETLQAPSAAPAAPGASAPPAGIPPAQDESPAASPAPAPAGERPAADPAVEEENPAAEEEDPPPEVENPPAEQEPAEPPPQGLVDAGVTAGGSAASGSRSSYHSLVKVTPAVETGLPSAKRGL